MITTMEFEAMKGSVLLFSFFFFNIGGICRVVELWVGLFVFVFHTISLCLSVILALFCYCVSNCDLFE